MLYIIGAALLVIGFIFKLLPPRKINSIYGYRSRLSMKNQDIWDEAQRYSAISLIILGLAYIVVGFVLSQVFKELSEVYQGIIFIVGIIIMLIFDEAHLRKSFNPDGSRK